MQKQTRSLLEELESLGDKRDASHLIESRASNIITSAINLLDMISKQYGPEKAEILERKLLNAIKSRDQGRFMKSLKRADINVNE
jgi:hypothetical protein